MPAAKTAYNSTQSVLPFEGLVITMLFSLASFVYYKNNYRYFPCLNLKYSCNDQSHVYTSMAMF